MATQNNLVILDKKFVLNSNIYLLKLISILNKNGKKNISEKKIFDVLYELKKLEVDDLKINQLFDNFFSLLRPKVSLRNYKYKTLKTKVPCFISFNKSIDLLLRWISKFIKLKRNKKSVSNILIENIKLSFLGKGFFSDCLNDHNLICLHYYTISGRFIKKLNTFFIK